MGIFVDLIFYPIVEGDVSMFVDTIPYLTDYKRLCVKLLF